MRRFGGDDGSVLVLIVGFAAVVLLLIAVVTDVSAVFLARRSLTSQADGAAVAAAQAIDEEAFYTGTAPPDRLPLDRAAAERAAADYLAGARLSGGPIRLRSAAVRDGRVTVTLTGQARPPFRRFLAGSTVALTAVAAADSPLG